MHLPEIAVIEPEQAGSTSQGSHRKDDEETTHGHLEDERRQAAQMADQRRTQ
jgi:hypothetical protein